MGHSETERKELGRSVTAPTREGLLEVVYQLDPKLKEKQHEEARDAALFLLGAAVDGPSRANRTVKIPARRAARFKRNLVSNGVFADGKICANWADPHEGVTSFWLDVNVALGTMERARSTGTITKREEADHA